MLVPQRDQDKGFVAAHNGRDCHQGEGVMARKKKPTARRKKAVKRPARKKPTARKKAVARKKPIARKKPLHKKTPARKKLTPPKKPPHKKHPRKPPKTPPKRHFPPGSALPVPARWLQQNPSIASALLWQFRPASLTNAYAPPAASDKVAWPNWSAQQKNDLARAYDNYETWLASGAQQVGMGAGGLSDAPTNVHPNATDDTITVMQRVTPAYMWKLYIAHVAMALALEINQVLPWSIRHYSSMALRYLFDSSTMAWELASPSPSFSMGTYALFVPGQRADNLPKTAFAPPKWTYPFLVRTGLVGNTRLDTIERVLQWMRQNLWHFFGADTFGTCNAVWQYRGYPPISRIIAGTIDANNSGQGRQHWTLGCHGSVGFLNALLRVVNIPVQPVWICGHELACFMTEGKYIDHGDDPYNLNVRNSTASISNVLISEATYQAQFTSNLNVNITDSASPVCPNVGATAANFPP
jgi:hypothetical protein